MKQNDKYLHSVQPFGEAVLYKLHACDDQHHLNTTYPKESRDFYFRDKDQLHTLIEQEQIALLDLSSILKRNKKYYISLHYLLDEV